MKKFLAVAALSFVSAFATVNTADAKARYSHDQARATSSVMFLTSGYPAWAIAAFGGGETGSAE